MEAELKAHMPTDTATSLIAPFSGSVSSSNTVLENETIYHLIRGNAAPNTSTIINGSTTPVIYNNASGSAVAITARKYSPDDINQCELLTSPGLHDGSFAVSTNHQNNIDNYNPISIDFGVSSYNNIQNFEVDDKTSSLYDSHIKLEYADNNGPFYDASGDSSGSRFNATFTADASGSYLTHFQKMLNSRYGNKENVDVMNVTEDTFFNTTYALGSNMSVYYTLNADGTRGVAPIPQNYRYDTNNYTIATVNTSNLRETDFGTYRIQQLSSIAQVAIFDSSSNAVGDNETHNMPVHIGDAQDSSGNSTYLLEDPTSITKFESLFKKDTSGSIVDSNNVAILSDYKFTLDISPGDSGFSFSSSLFANANKTVNNNLVTLVDTDLDDNVYLMKNWVNNPCDISFINGTVKPTLGTNGISATLNAMTVDNDRECLDELHIANNGEIIINTRDVDQRALITQDSNTLPISIVSNVHYETDTLGNQPLNIIPDTFKSNSNVKLESQVVFKNPIYGNAFLTSGNSALNLIANNVLVNKNFSENNWEFASNVQGQSNKAEIFKIIPQKHLDDVNSLKDSLGQIVNNVYSSVIVQDLNSPMNQGEYSGKLTLDLKTISDLSIANDFAENGWTITSQNDGYLHADSNAADAYDGDAWPNVDEVTQMNELGTSLEYKILFYNNDFKDNIYIKWGLDTNYGNTLIVPQTLITRNDISTNSESTIIASSAYTLTSSLIGKQVTLYKIVTTKEYSLTFPLLLRPYVMTDVTTPVFTVQTTFYKLKNNVTDTYYTDGYLNYVKVGTTTPYRSISEIILSGTQMVTGTLLADDIKELKANVKITHVTPGTGDGVTVDTTVVSTPKDVSLLFRSDTAINIDIIPSYDAGVSVDNVQLWLQYQLLDDLGNYNLIKINDHNGYSIDLSNKTASATDFTLAYWSSAPIDFGINSNISTTNGAASINTNIIDPYNGFSNVVGWTSTSKYYLDISLDDNNETTILSIKNSISAITEYIITLKNNNFYATPMYISRGIQDVWRIRTTIGTTSTEIFKGVDYNIETSYIHDSTYNPIADDPKLNVVALTDGVYLKPTTGVLDFNYIPLGKVIKLSILPDLINVNMVGPAASLLKASINSLIYKYDATPYYSKTLTIPYYRGYIGFINTDQHYTIERTKTSAKIRFYTTSPVSEYAQTVDVYTGTVAFNNFLLNGSMVGNYNKLNLKAIFGCSILSNTDASLYAIYTKGDTVTITTSNPKATATINTINKTLKNYLLYQFSGSNFNSTGNPFIINSSRLRFLSGLKTNSFIDPSSTKSFVLTLSDRSLNIYKLSSVIGNPVNHKDINGNLEVSNPDIVPSAWGDAISSSNYAQTLEGILFANGAYKITRNSGYVSNSICFITVHPPMLNFTAIAHKVDPESVPYSTTQLAYTSNTINYSIPVNQSGLYNPFAESVSYLTSENTLNPSTGLYTTNTIVHTNNNTKINNITFVDAMSQLVVGTGKKYAGYKALPDNTPHKIIVRPQNMTITLNSKLSDQIGAPSDVLTTILANQPANKLSKVSNITFTPTNFNTGGLISFTQDTTAPYMQSYDNITGLTSTVNPNILFTIPSFFAPRGTIVKLDLPTGKGTVVHLYTRNIIKDNSDNTYKVVIYKYIPFSNVVVDWNNYENNIDANYINKTSIGVKFTKRQHKIFNIPQRILQDTTIETFQTLLNKISFSDITLNTNWTDAENYPLDNNAPWFSFCSLTKHCIRTLLPQFFAPPEVNSGYAKMNIVTRTKILEITDKLGNVVCALDHDCIFMNNFISSAIIAYQTSENNGVPATYNDTIARSVLGYARQGPPSA